MPVIKTDDKISERLLSIDWGQQQSDRMPAPAAAPQPVVELRNAAVTVRIDEVFHNINAYRAFMESGISRESMLAKSLISQANAIFNQAFVNLESRHGFARVYMDVPMERAKSGMTDITELAVEEVLSLQSILRTAA